MKMTRLVAAILLTLATACLLYACSGGSTTSEDAEAVSSHELIHDGNNGTTDIVVGEGFTHANRPDPQGVGATCLAENAEVEFAPFGNGADDLAEIYRPFVSHSLTDTVDKLKYRLWPSDRQLTETWYGRSQSAKQEVIKLYESQYYQNQSYGEEIEPDDHQEVLSILLYIRTMKEEVQGINPDNQTEQCHQSYDNIQEWNENCGDSYLDREIYGGFVLLTVRVEEMEVEQRQELYTLLGVDQKQHLANFRELIQNELADFQFNFHGILLNGLRAPQGGLLSGGNTILGENLDVYLDNLRYGDEDGEFTGYSNLGYPEEYYPVSEAGWIEVPVEETGWIVQQDFEDYPADYLNFCGPFDTPEGGYSCYADFFAHEVQVDTLYQEWLQKAEFEYNNKSKYCWGPNAYDAQVRHYNFIQELTQCNNQLPQTKSDCTDAFTQGEPQSAVCDFCSPPSSCDREKIERMRSELFEPVLKRPNGLCFRNYGPVEGGNDKVLDATSDSLCVLSQVAGKFDGTTESVVLDTSASAGSGGPAWYLDATSNHQFPNVNTMARAICAPKALFTDAGSNSWFTESDGGINYNSNTNLSTGSDVEKGVALNGVKGDFDGGGEYARIYRNTAYSPDKWFIKANSASGAILSARWTAFGLDSPSGTPATAEFWSFAQGEDTANSQQSDALSTGHHSKVLAPANKAICYLRKFQGQFDGRGESIRIDQGQNSGSWILRVKGACKSKPNFVAGGCEFDDFKKVAAEASCYLYDQSN